MQTLIDTVSGIDPQLAALLGTALGVVVLLGLRQRYGHTPSFWRARRLLLPTLAELGRGDHPVDEALENVDLGEAVPEKTRLGLRDEELAGTLDATPAEVRAELRERERWYGAPLASIQYERVDGERVYEVGSYAYRSQGPLDEWQVHLRLTPRDGGRRTALWVHREKSPWRRPVEHYRAEGWSSEEGVREIAAQYASDERYEPSDRAVELIGTGEAGA